MALFPDAEIETLEHHVGHRDRKTHGFVITCFGVHAVRMIAAKGINGTRENVGHGAVHFYLCLKFKQV